jgi:hypothetical protein
MSREPSKQQRVNSLESYIRAIELQREPALFIGHPHSTSPVSRAEIQRGVEYHRMNMQVKMPVNV